MNAEQRSRVRLSNPAHFLALGAGSGLAAKMPGTFGTLAAVPLVWLLLETVSLNVYIFLCLIASVAGIWICGKTADDMGVHDDSSIVWDEVAGMMITMIAVPLSWQTMLAGFVLFRIFDILKPWPISYLDKYVHGGFGIMADDVLAGIAALVSLHLLVHFTVL
ncbi:phosphatidylglycerophosphatase A [Aliiglaciecola sp. 3_MG-2023]|uniref:phosphatidylglycerophosphatase A family protein n=1 Tax=Aliiglaciecola sp. 3_MG-2023 TaxID=3062644 RepID=UPI0026E2292D|nr:phosphatidylglycerophosphatase A [Aliiglaciecola sp. 3_MG-2023]MDO6693960.1 phosphatidylglycerophosphatase A [Aliiglaciecola sp. 3_MG-2023]